MRTTFFGGLVRPFIILLAAFALSPAATASSAYEEPSGLGNAHISYLEGDVLFRGADTDDWAAAAPNLALRDGDRLWAGDDSRLEVDFRGGHFAWVNYKSGLDVLGMDIGRDGTGDTHHVSLPFGEASFAVANFRELGSVFQVDTPGASVRAYGAARFRMIALSDGSTQVGVYDGSVEVESGQGVRTVREGDLLEVDARGTAYFQDLPRPDSWDRWVESRHDRYARGYDSERYIPVEMRDYAYEFEGNGRWVSYPGYGFVWVPRVEPLWSPYSNGRWVWSGGNYIWLSSDPWYAPFHFGRWAWTASLGWYWVPPGTGHSYWSPGYVGWSYGPTDLYWVPLAPGEIYYGYGYYGPLSINIHIRKSFRVTNRFENCRVRNAVVGQHRADFIEGRHKKVRFGGRDRDNPFLRDHRRDVKLIGRPPVEELRPGRRTRHPNPERRVTDTMRPPDWLGRHSDDIRKGRSVARKADESAFRGGGRPRRVDDGDRERGRGRPAPDFERGRDRDRETRDGRERGIGAAEGTVLPTQRPKTLEEQGREDLERERGRVREDREPDRTREERDRRDRRDDGRVEQPRTEEPRAGESNGRTRDRREQAAPSDTIRREQPPDEPRGRGIGAAEGTVPPPEQPRSLEEQGRDNQEREQGRVREERNRDRTREERDRRDRRDDGRVEQPRKEQPRTEQPRVREPRGEERNTRQPEVVKPRADEAPAARQPGVLGGGQGFDGAQETAQEYQTPKTFEEQGREALEREQMLERGVREGAVEPEQTPQPPVTTSAPAAPQPGAPESAAGSGGKAGDGPEDTGRDRRRDRRDRRD